MIKCIIFDLDGVILDSEPLHFKAHAKALEAFGIKLSLEDYLEFGVAKGDENLYEKMAEKNNIKIDREAISKLKKQIFEELLSQGAGPINGVADILESWNQKYILAIGSSGARDMVESVLDKMKFRKYFSIVVTADDVEKVKPSPDIYLKAIELAGFSKEECLAIEDSESGLAAAKAAGLKCAVVPCDFTRSQNFSEADLILDKLAEINPEKM